MGGGISDVALAAAVTNAGGLGMLGAGGLPVDAVTAMLDAMSKATDRPFGVNFLVPFLDRDVVAVAARRCRVCDFHWGEPDPSLVELVHREGAVAGWQVGSSDEAATAAAAGCDFIIAQGVEAGGHVRGVMPLDHLLADVLARIGLPVVASGGIGTPDRVAELLNRGAAAVRIGTRFVAALESPAHPDYVDALIAASEADTELTELFGAEWPNAPHRVLRSCIEAAKAATDDVTATFGEGENAVPVVRFSSTPPHRDVRGNIGAMAQYAGTSVSHVRRRQSAAEIVAELCSKL
jgi:nitronate monooxygenase